MSAIPLQNQPAMQPAQAGVGADKKLKFGRDNTFQVELRRRVDAFFRTTGGHERDCPQMYLKTAVLLSLFAALYGLLVFGALHWWQALPLSILLGMTTAAIGFNVQHDGGHQAYSNRPWINKAAAMVLDLVGGSSYLWHWKHVVYHHTYTNITGHDTDIELGGLGRLTPYQKWHWYERWQHLYLWPLYGLVVIKWHLYDDFKDAVIGRVGIHKIPRPKRLDLVVFITGKVLFLTLAFGIPIVFHPIWVVFLFYGIAALTTGVVMSVVFQLAHCVEQADFSMPEPGSGRIENAWAVHEVQSTIDFARRSKILAWLLGGLNFQIEHHLFPRICHINYPAMSPVVEQTCREFGVKYTEHVTFPEAVASHYRWLRMMGKPGNAVGTLGV